MPEPQSLHATLRRQWQTVSYLGLVVGTLFFAASLTPSLLPRNYIVQGLLSGLALGAGYSVGVALVLLWLFLELPRPAAWLERPARRITTGLVAAVAVLFLWQETLWQNSIRERMEMPPVATGYPLRVAFISAAVGVLLVAAARGLFALWRSIHARVSRRVPRRVSYVVTTSLIGVALLLLVNNVLAWAALNAADRAFLAIDMGVDEGLAPPREPTASGSPASLIAWDTIGRQGKTFVLNGPRREAIAAFTQRPAKDPLRVYVGLGTRSTMAERAALAVDELERVGGFDRSLLVVATPTGTGWLDPGAVDTVEYLHSGDTAIVSMQYSYLPSWITILVDPLRSRDSARALFDAVYERWKSLPRDRRPKLYVHGLSLGSLGSESSADLFTIFDDPIQGGVWSGPPFPSVGWSRLTASRNLDSPMWLPRFHDGSLVRFTAQKNALAEAGPRWGSMRFVYVQYASDPMVFFSTDLLYRRPEWLSGPRGPDVSPELRWFPIVTFLQVAMDLPMATSVPIGYGHNYAPAHYIDAWREATDPKNWTDADIARLKEHFATLQAPDAASKEKSERLPSPDSSGSAR